MTVSASTPFGRSELRREDEPLLRGDGRYTGDIDLFGQCHAAFVRSDHAHAYLRSINPAAALEMPGVIGVLCASDLDADGIGPLIERNATVGIDGRTTVNVARPLLVADRAMFAGDIVAMVLAETLEQALGALEAVELDLDPLETVVDPRVATAPDTVELWPEAPNNCALDWAGGDAEATERAFDRADHVTRLALTNNRIYPACMEGRGAVAEYDRSGGRYTVHTGTQGSGALVGPIAAALGVSPGRVRVITPDVGGAFGAKIPPFPEHVLVAWAARRVGRPVKWISERAEGFLSDAHGRDHHTEAELALDAEGHFLAVRTRTVSNMGAYSTGAAPTIPTGGGTRCIKGVYVIPAWHARTKVVFTNTAPVHAFRGAGKPEYNYIIERLVDAAARETGRDPAQLRRLNAVTPAMMPYDTGTGIEFDTGEFAANMDDALRLAAREGFETRRRESADRGRLRGLGFALFQEPDGFLDNRVALVFAPHGRLSVTITGQDGGHGHATTFAQVAAARLGIAMDNVDVAQGDSDQIGPGRGTGGSRTATVASVGIARAADTIVEKAKRIAAEMMEANAADVEFLDGAFAIAGTDRQVTMTEVVKASFDPKTVAERDELGLDAASHYVAKKYNYPCGCHVCEVEVDPETGTVELLRYCAVNDHGVAINPMLLEGQMHGGVAQGLGQAMLEECVYDDDGQLLSGSFMDYALPRAADLPSFEIERNCVPSKTNPLGVKGVGESGCTAALPALVNAVVDALAPLGVEHIDMPVTPEKVWRICRLARGC